jgi:hypothetical protein
MADDSLTGQYSVVASFLAGYIPSWLSGDPLNAARIASYAFYDNLYWNDAGGFRMTIRGDEEFPVYVPSARRIVNTFNRYVARNMSIDIRGENADQVEAAKLAFEVLFKREAFYSNFKHSKRLGLIKGDMVIGIFADPFKPDLERISLVDVDPAKFFPIVDPDDSKKIWGQRIIEQVKVGDKNYIHIQRWIKSTHPEHPSYNEEAPDYEADIAFDQVLWEMESWDDPEKRKTFRVDTPLEPLPGIKTLPLYHFANNKDPNNIYGTSDLKGLERIFLDINQTATDESVAIAMAGLGVYVSDSSPVDSDGAATDWVLGPKRVVEVPVGGKFDRVSGVASVDPTQGHMDWMQAQAESVLGISDVALGQVDVTLAESGIALQIRMGPLLDASADRDGEIADKLIQMFHDLKTWFAVYERINLGDSLTGAIIEPVFGQKLPTNNKEEMDRLAQLFLDNVIPIQVYWEKLRALGVELPDDADMGKMFEEAQALVDPEGARLAAEGADDGSEGVTENDGELG